MKEKSSNQFHKMRSYEPKIYLHKNTNLICIFYDKVSKHKDELNARFVNLKFGFLPSLLQIQPPPLFKTTSMIWITFLHLVREKKLVIRLLPTPALGFSKLRWCSATRQVVELLEYYSPSSTLTGRDESLTDEMN